MSEHENKYPVLTEVEIAKMQGHQNGFDQAISECAELQHEKDELITELQEEVATLKRKIRNFLFVGLDSFNLWEAEGERREF